MIDTNAFKGKVVALVGGAGFIGHNLALELKALGAEPHVIDGLQVNNLGAFTSGLNPNPNNNLYVGFAHLRLDLLRQAKIPLHIIDARDYHVLSPCLNAIKPDVVIHLAAVAHANRSNKDPFSTFDHSMRTLENVLDSVRVDRPHVIYLSSSMVYGNFDGDAVTEDRRCEPMGIYGALKYGAEKLVIAYNQVFELPYTIIRPSALYGERCVSRRVGQAFIENAIRGKSLSINGDGTDGLDFTYIKDFCQGVLLSIAKPEARNEIFNITFGSARSLNDLAGLVLEYFPGLHVIHNPRDALMPERGTLSIDKARRLLGYDPQFPVDKGFVQYIQWYKQLAATKPELFSEE
ncbi:MAG: NAD-dependent epimerase/dehydratase family protein [Rhodocyclaceae bacterium]|nr:NAD-dependent epimerase/dehydratase family protein [Rhodocyclaceae bacterium]MDZ4215553.1 NAD-dependent epimerase/dehydratase family protein [Rhodocyclaceae bacterium]